MDKIKTVKIKNEDGTVSEESYSISVDATNVDMSNGKDLQDTVGNINIDEDGNIAEQLKNIKKKIYYFDTVMDMKTADLQTGDTCQTLGYYKANDGGAGLYKIINSTLENNSGSIYILDNGLRAELIVEDRIINIMHFGVRGDGQTDDTQAIQNVINDLQNGDILYIPNGKYKITAQKQYNILDYGDFNPYYALYFNNKNNIKILCDGIFICDMSTQIFNTFALQNCNNIEITGIKGKYEGTTPIQTNYLHARTLIHVNKCENIKINNCESLNVGGNTIFVACKDCEVKNSKASRTSVNYKSPSLFACYKSENINIENNITYGSCDDGDIVIFGVCKNCKILNNKIFNTFESTGEIVKNTSQGYCVDSECYSCSIINNYAYGYFYGIDTKTNCENTLISENILEKNKISITSRLGEGHATNYDTQIVNNIIKINNGNGNKTVMMGNVYNIGIYIEHNEGIMISNNNIGNDTVVNGYTIPFIAIGGIDSTETNRPVEKNNLITNNIINLETRKGNNYAYSDSPAIYLQGLSSDKMIKNYIILNNTIKSHYTQNNNYYDIVLGYAYNILIGNNLFTVKPNSNGYIKIDNSDLISINGNSFNSSNKAFSVTNTTNLVINNNTIRSSGNTNYSYLIDSCTNFKISDNYYQKTGSIESDVGVIRSSTNGIVQNNVAVTTKSHFYATPTTLPNTNVTEDNTVIFN